MDIDTGVKPNDSCPYLVFSVVLLRRMVPNLLLGGSVEVGCVMSVEDSEVFVITCGSCAEATANTMAMCMSIRPLKLLWTVICEHFNV
jgi:citrate lyase synthetase